MYFIYLSTYVPYTYRLEFRQNAIQHETPNYILYVIL